MKGLFSALWNRNEAGLEAHSQVVEKPFAPLRDAIRERSKRGKVSTHEEEQLSRLQRLKKGVRLALRLTPREEFVLTRYHPQLVQPFRNDRKSLALNACQSTVARLSATAQ